MLTPDDLEAVDRHISKLKSSTERYSTTVNPRKYWVIVDKPGDSYFTGGSAVPYAEFEEERKKILDRGGKPPTIRIRFEEPSGNGGGGKLLPALKPFDPYKFADYVLRNNVFSDADTFIYSGLSRTNPHGVPDHIWAESLANMGGEFVKTGDLYVVKTPGVERPPDMRARPTWPEVTPLMSTEPELSPSTINLLATTEGDPIRKFCCRQCGECAPAELLEEGKFPERIAWLRSHYKAKHPGRWGKVHPAVFPQDLAEKVRELWRKACEWEDIPLESRFVVFSEDNPFVKDYNEAVGQLLRWKQFRTGEWAPATTFKKGEGTRLDGLEIVKAYKQISRHGEDKISVTLQAWALFPKGRRPHFISMYRSGDDYVITPLYAHISEWVHVPVVKVKAWIKSLPVRHFEPMAVAPEYREEAERLAKEVDESIGIIPLPSMARQAAVIPTEPSGKCYEDAWRFIKKEEEGELIHGSIESQGKRIGHAWVETETGYIWEPEHNTFFTKP